MIAVDREALPKRICKSSAINFAGESAHWYCSGCGQWRTSEITVDGSITCPVCGLEPDWQKHQPTLAYGSRFKRVADLCANGSPWRQRYDEVERRYSQFIDEVNAGLPLRTREAGWRYFRNAWKEIDGIADYLLTAQDAPAVDSVNVYTERGLQRRYYDSRRKYNITSLSGLNLPPMTDDGGVRYTDQEVAEIISFHNACSEPFYDTYFADEFLESIRDSMERAIAYDFSRGMTKRDIERRYGLTEQQTRTKVKHIAKSLKAA